ncbi:hypothetical protein PSAC2689_70297 [Paraburkholderia sacchari]
MSASPRLLPIRRTIPSTPVRCISSPYPNTGRYCGEGGTLRLAGGAAGDTGGVARAIEDPGNFNQLRALAKAM